MLITLDRMAQRYSVLPSDLLERSSTFDLYCMDIGIRYEHVQEQKRKGTYQKQTPKLSEDQMKKMLKQTRERK